MAETALKVIETSLSETSVRMRCADHADPTQATEWIEFQVPVAALMLDQHNPLGNPQARPLALVQRAALARVSAAIDAEIEHLSALRRP